MRLLGFPDSSVGKESACNAGETGVSAQGWEDSLEKRKATHSRILAWRIPWTVYSPCGCEELDTTERLSLSLFIATNYLSIKKNVLKK